MKTSAAANYLNDYLSIRIEHPLTFPSNDAMIHEINQVQGFMATRHPVLRESPFITAVHVANNTRVPAPGEPQVDDFRLFNTCLAYLAMTPVDELPASAITVFSKIAESVVNDVDKFRVVNLLTNTIIRADELNHEDSQRLKQSCAEAATDLRQKGFFCKEFEQEVSKRVSRDHGMEFVDLLGFDINNIPSLRQAAARMNRQESPAMGLPKP